MTRLLRPPISLAIRLDVALRQKGVAGHERTAIISDITKARRLRATLELELINLAKNMGCASGADIDLDHDPALENREKLIETPAGGYIRSIIVPKGYKVKAYFPDANDPEHLFYRPRAREAAGSHKIKTTVRGDHGQLSDLSLANKNKNIKRNRSGVKKTKIKGLSFQQQRCRRGMRCSCDRRSRKSCVNYRR
jgi:hypothetical protein